MGGVVRSLGKLVYLDSNIVVHAMEGYEQFAAPIRSLLAEMDAGAVVGTLPDTRRVTTLLFP
ncbi:MAG: hypothetical protein JXQ73_01200 [Phycisphaerae bacterium]|nr:hypothetical protein [Phycisphaerae bacterium]